jgi:fatty-acyl-CoA synthase
VPADGRTVGEVMLLGNTVMLGYLKDTKATDAAFRRGWFHTGDLAVQHPDGYIEIKDRLKDIIISGGENISSIEVEIALTRHPAVLIGPRWRDPTRNGARRRARSSSSRMARRRPRTS